MRRLPGEYWKVPKHTGSIRIRIRIRVLDPYRASLGAGAAPPDYHFLDARQLSTEERERFPFIANWTDHFDYLLVLNAEGAGDLDRYLPDKIEVDHRKGVAALFRVRHSGAGLRAAAAQ